MKTHRGGPAVLVLALAACANAGTIIRVPADQPSIQGGIDAASNGDTVLVAPGFYVENINFRGKAITVISEQGTGITIIDGGARDSVATFASGEGLSSVLSGFTLQNGLSTFSTPSFGDGGGVSIRNTSPTIQNNLIWNNRACNGIGIHISFGSPLIQGNTITTNTRTGCSGGIGGAGIAVSGPATAQILNNVITHNSLFGGGGGGISLFGAGAPTISGNIISQNSVDGISPCATGGGIEIGGQSNALIVNNLITGNSAGCGGGIYWLLTPTGSHGPFVINNTIAGNTVAGFNAQGSGVYADGFDGQSQLVNNIITAPSGKFAVYCGNFNNVIPPTFKFNDVFADTGLAYGGICSNQTGLNGNISADPLFFDPAGGDFHVGTTSPVIDAGTADSAPGFDLEGNTRPVDGNNDGTATIDIGVYEAAQTGVTPADLTITKVNNVHGTVIFPNPWTWSIAVANHGGLPAFFSANQIILRDNLPSNGVTYGIPSIIRTASISGTGSISCALNLSDLVCSATGGGVTIGVEGVFVVQLTATPSEAGTVGNPRSGGICAADPDGVLAERSKTNNACRDSVVIPGPDLQLTKVISAGAPGGAATAGSNVTYLLTATNGGPSPAHDVTITDNLPANTTFVSCNVSAGTCGVHGSTVTANLGSLANGAQGTLTLVVQVGAAVADGTTILNQANVSSSLPDPNSANNFAGPVFFAVRGAADLLLTKVIVGGVSDGIATAGSNVTYLITVTNNGPGIAPNVVVADSLPMNATYVSCATSVGGCGFDHGPFSANFGSLPSGAQAILTITVNVGCGAPSGTVVTNTASVSSSAPDSVPGNNSSGPVTFTVRQPNPTVNVSVPQNVFTLNNHDLVSAGLTAAATYTACPTSTSFVVQVYGNQDDETPTAKNEVYSPDAANIALGSLRLRAERVDSGDGRIYLIVVTGTSAAGSTGFGTATIVVPKSSSAPNVASALSQAAAAAAYANANNGIPPPGYLLIGDGPVIGPKQ